MSRQKKEKTIPKMFELSESICERLRQDAFDRRLPQKKVMEIALLEYWARDDAHKKDHDQSAVHSAQ